MGSRSRVLLLAAIATLLFVPLIVHWVEATPEPEPAASLPTPSPPIDTSEQGPPRRVVVVSTAAQSPTTTLPPDASEAKPAEAPRRSTESGTIEVVLERHGVPWFAPTIVELIPVASRAAAGLVGTERVRESASSGRARFAGIPLHREFWLVANSEGGTFERVDPFAGPSLPGDTLEVLFDLDSTPYIRFRVIDASGRLATSTKLRLMRHLQREGSGLVIEEEVTTDAEGVCRLRWPEPIAQTTTRSVRIELTTRFGIEGADRSIPAPDPGGSNDLGDVPLERPPLLVAGRVVDPAGRPVAGAKIEFEYQLDPPADALFMGWGSGFRSDEAGQFRLHLTSSGERLAINATAPGYAPAARQRFEIGEQAVVLTLRTPATLELRLLHDPLLDGSNMTCELNPESDFIPDSRATSGGIARAVPVNGSRTESRIVFEDLGPGRFSARLWSGGLWLTTVGGIEIDSKDVERKIDLRGSLVPVTLRVVDEAGRDIPDASARFSGTSTPYPSRDGRIELLVRKETGGGVRVDAPGFRPVLLDALRKSQTVTLKPSIRVVLVVKGTVALRRDHRSLRLQIDAPQDGSSLPPLPGDASLGDRLLPEHRRLELELTVAGRYRAQWYSSEETARTSRSVALGRPFPIDVPESAVPLTIEIDPPTDW